MKEERGQFEELMSKAFEGHEMPVRSELWTSIQSQVAANAAATSGTTATGGLGLITKVGMVAGISGLMTVATISEVKYQNQFKPADNVGVFEKTEQVEETTDQDQKSVASYDAKPAEAVIQVVDTDDSENNDASTAIADISENPSKKVKTENSEQIKLASTHDPAKSPIVDQSKPEESDGTEKVEKTNSNPGTQSSGVKGGAENEDSPLDSNGNNAETQKDDSEIKDLETTPPHAITPEPEVAETKEPFVKHRNEGPLTPNGDGKNDYFSVEAKDVTNFLVIIMNRAGQKVYTSTDPGFKWEGRDMRGQYLPSGVYYFVITATNADGEPYEGKGSQTLFR